MFTEMAGVFALFLTVIGFGMLFNAKLFVDAFDDIRLHPGLRVVTGVIPVLIGSILVSTHSIWVWAWPVALTIFGYVLFVVASLRYLFMSQWIRYVSPMITKTTIRLIGLVLFALGLYLGYNYLIFTNML